MVHHDDKYGAVCGIVIGVIGSFDPHVPDVLNAMPPIQFIEIWPIVVSTFGAIYYGAIGGLVGWAVKKAMDHLSEVYKKRKRKKSKS